MGRKYDFELLLVRHGDAHDWSEAGDAGRELTERGVRALEACVPAFQRFDWHWSAALTSPYVRARQTADIFWKGLAPSYAEAQGMILPEPLIDDGLVPGGDTLAVLQRIVELGESMAGPRPRIAVFGHNPNISRMFSVMMTGSPDALQVSFGRGDVAHMFVPAASPFDMVLDPLEREPLPRAVLLGFYPHVAQRAAAESWPGISPL